MIQFRYRSDVDGLRAVAIFLVILFHTHLGFPGGYVGVDVFFVISGFLITGLIIKKQQEHRFSLIEFWERRIRRIIPAATVMVAATLAAGSFLLLPNDLAELTESAIWQQLMLSNVFFWKFTSYFGGPAETKALLHTWSLAVEEQFYLGFPILLIFLKRFSKRVSIVILLTLFFASLGLSEWGVRYHPIAAFFLLPTRMWEFLLGALLVFLPVSSRQNIFWLNCWAWIGFLGILFSASVFEPTNQFPGLKALLPCVATALVIYANSAKQNVARLFTVASLVGFHWADILLSLSLALANISISPLLVWSRFVGCIANCGNCGRFFVFLSFLEIY